MPLPIIFIGIAAVTGATGVGAKVKIGVDQSRANTINNDANSKIEAVASRLDVLRLTI